jgi:hypothetical protein
VWHARCWYVGWRFVARREGWCLRVSLGSQRSIIAGATSQTIARRCIVARPFLCRSRTSRASIQLGGCLRRVARAVRVFGERIIGRALHLLTNENSTQTREENFYDREQDLWPFTCTDGFLTMFYDATMLSHVPSSKGLDLTIRVRVARNARPQKPR